MVNNNATAISTSIGYPTGTLSGETENNATQAKKYAAIEPLALFDIIFERQQRVARCDQL